MKKRDISPRRNCAQIARRVVTKEAVHGIPSRNHAESQGPCLHFVNKTVTVKAAGLNVEGVLLSVDQGEHGGLGNLLLQQADRLLLVKGSEVQLIGIARV